MYVCETWGFVGNADSGWQWCVLFDLFWRDCRCERAKNPLQSLLAEDFMPRQDPLDGIVLEDLHCGAGCSFVYPLLQIATSANGCANGLPRCVASDHQCVLRRRRMICSGRSPRSGGCNWVCKFIIEWCYIVKWILYDIILIWTLSSKRSWDVFGSWKASQKCSPCGTNTGPLTPGIARRVSNFDDEKHRLENWSSVFQLDKT